MVSKNFDTKRLETLIEINNLINSNYSDVNALLTRILESATKLSSSEASSLLLLHPESNKLYFEIALGSKGPDVKKYSLNLGEGIAGWVAKNNRSLIVNDVDTDERFFSDIGKKVGFSTKSILAVPMRIKEKCVGVLEILNKSSGDHFNNEDLEWLEIFANQAAIAIQNARSFQKIQNEIYMLQDQMQQEKGFHTLVYKSSQMHEILNLIDRIGKTDSSVLIQGETGVGKELIAERIHLCSKRRNAPFIRVNCAALPEHLLESELFGHVKGAFTDAIADRRGRFELADSGTIFLDEIGDMDIGLQSKLLRVIQDRIFEKVGSAESIKVDVRIIAATNQDLMTAIGEGTFRQDLFYRLNVLPLHIPPLRERREDILELADFFLQKAKRDTNKKIIGFSPDAADLLINYQWPGNIRELENVVERAVVIARDAYILPSDLMLGGDIHKDRYEGKTLKEAVNLFKRAYIKNVLTRHSGRQTKTAEHLGIQRTYLSKLIKELGIE